MPPCCTHRSQQSGHPQQLGGLFCDQRPVTRVDTKWRSQFFAKYDYRFLLDVIIAIIATIFAKAIIAILPYSLNISLE
jgi:hypothetical protein